MVYYKVLNKDLKAKDGGSFDYTKFIKSKEWLPVIEDVSICNKGYHITEFWNMWINDKTNRIFEVECKDIQEENEIGVKEKFVCKSFRFIKEVKFKFDKKLNTGELNTGYRNTGDSNTGNWNICDKETGFFNTKQSKTIRVFNKNVLVSVWEKCSKPDFIYFELKEDYKKSFIESFNKTTKEDVEKLLKLPNFNYKVFEEISGISKKMITNKLKLESVKEKCA